ncbi:MAG: sedoheptulokinase [Spirochaetaceae bacterium]
MGGFVVGLDVGTTSIALVPITREGTVLPGRSREHRAEIRTVHPWESLQDPEKLLRTARELLRECVEELGPPEAIGVCSQMHGPVYLGARGEAVTPLYTWLDGRGDLPLPGSSGDSSHTPTDSRTSYAAHLSRITGASLSSGFALVTHYFLQSGGDVPPNARAIATAGDFVATSLAGRSRPLMDATQAHSFGAYDPGTGGWSFDRARKAGLPAPLLPEIVPAGTILGTWTDSAQTRVTTCVGDNQTSVLGAAKSFFRDGVLSIGTSGQISVHVETPESPNPAIDVRPFPAPGYLAVGASLTGGKAYQTLREFLDDVCVRFGSCAPHSVTYERMNEVAEELMRSLEERATAPLDDPDMPNVDTRFLGARSDPRARAAISNLTPWNFTAGHVTLGLLSGMIDELHQLFLTLPEATRESTERLSLTGNALRRNPVLQKLAQLHFDLPTYLPAHSEEAAVGAAIVAGVGIGIWSSYEEACAAVAADEHS